MRPAFDEVWCVDFEFRTNAGDLPEPVCLVALELCSGREMRLWAHELRRRKTPPYRCDRHALFVSYVATAELVCHLVLGWALPAVVLDLYIEFCRHTNGRTRPAGKGLLGALTYFGIQGLDPSDKEEMRNLIVRGSYSPADKRAILDYCRSDVVGLQALFPAMLPHIDWPRALLRGRYMRSLAHTEWWGIPLDTGKLAALLRGWEYIRESLIAEIDAPYGVYEGTSFRQERFGRWLLARGMWWPTTPTGDLSTSDETFRDMSKVYPEVAPLGQLHHALGKLKLHDLEVGRDGRNRTKIWPVGAKTGRNAPSSTKYIFGPAVWLRHLIKPPTTSALVYLDWSAQEFAIAAVLSGDPNMLADYSSGDPYTAFAKRAGAIPADGSKRTHPDVREQYKVVSLAVLYGMGLTSLANRLDVPKAYAEEILGQHKRLYRRFWSWQAEHLNFVLQQRWTSSVLGWTYYQEGHPRLSSLANFPMQANGGDMLRVASFLGVERGVKIIAPVHDAVLIECAPRDLASTITTMQQAMAQAGEIVLNGFQVRSDYRIVLYPERYRDPRGEFMWNTTQRLLMNRPLSIAS
jgi:DNA polymerase I